MPITTPNYFAVPFPIFEPAMRNILSITQGAVTTITTTFDGITAGDNQYASGLIVRILIPEGFGMSRLDKFVGTITVLNDTQFTLDIDSTTFDPFVVPSYQPGHNGTPAQVVPIGEINELLSQATRNVLPRP